MRELLIRNLRRFDGLAGLVAGLNSLMTLTWLADLYGVPRSILFTTALANLIYGTLSSTLVLLPKRPLVTIKLLSIAN